MIVSYVIVTRNRREPLLRTLAHLHAHTSLPRDAWETWVVDNASTDGTREAVGAGFPDVHVIARRDNGGAPARSDAFGRARGRYLVLLDDDSYPLDDAVPRSVDRLEDRPDVAGVVGRVELPDGRAEACAMPAVMLSGAVCLRRSVLDEVGGFRPEFFRKAGEYDLSFRIWDAGHRIERYEDVRYRHDKVAGGRDPLLAHRLDLRNNLILAERFLPRELRRAYRADWLRRYARFARADGAAAAIGPAVAEGRAWARREAASGRRVLGAAALEAIFAHDAQHAAVSAWARAGGLRRVAIADWSKTLYATWQACRRAGLDVAAIVDDHPAYTGATYRGAPIRPVADLTALAPDGVVLANVNPAQIDERRDRVHRVFDGPILQLWHPARLGATPATAST